MGSVAKRYAEALREALKLIDSSEVIGQDGSRRVLAEVMEDVIGKRAINVLTRRNLLKVTYSVQPRGRSTLFFYERGTEAPPKN